jgi:hypothetical protein
MSGAMANTLFVRGTARFGRPDIGSIISEVGIGRPGTGDDFNGAKVSHIRCARKLTRCE